MVASARCRTAALRELAPRALAAHAGERCMLLVCVSVYLCVSTNLTAEAPPRPAQIFSNSPTLVPVGGGRVLTVTGSNFGHPIQSPSLMLRVIVAGQLCMLDKTSVCQNCGYTQDGVSDSTFVCVWGGGGLCVCVPVCLCACVSVGRWVGVSVCGVCVCVCICAQSVFVRGLLPFLLPYLFRMVELGARSSLVSSRS